MVTPSLSSARFAARLFTAGLWFACSGSAGLCADFDLASRKQEVIATEQAFADTMARRDFNSFCTFIDEEAVFRPTPEGLIGKAKITAAWKGFFEGEKAPFSWRPGDVQILASGDLALSNGPVFDPTGRPTWTFTSVWRRTSDGRWLIVFDQGNPLPAQAEEATK